MLTVQDQYKLKTHIGKLIYTQLVNYCVDNINLMKQDSILPDKMLDEFDLHFINTATLKGPSSAITQPGYFIYLDIYLEQSIKDGNINYDFNGLDRYINYCFDYMEFVLKHIIL